MWSLVLDSALPIAMRSLLFGCVVRVEQSVPEYNVRSTVFLKHCANWDSVGSAARRFTWNTSLKSADPLVAFHRAIGEVIGCVAIGLSGVHWHKQF